VSGLFQALRAKTSGLHLALRECNSGAESAGALFKCSKDSASLVVAMKKNFLDEGCRFFVSDVSGKLLGQLGPLHLTMGANCQMVVFRQSFYWKLG